MLWGMHWHGPYEISIKTVKEFGIFLNFILGLQELINMKEKEAEQEQEEDEEMGWKQPNTNAHR